eukprot:TRINITY_DN763_c0_g1_i1.p1 TRINITY_DN763_c0_g1~~TRINITY_DN763_c0_g1_i1.p1  ORF type:complete len:513 (-),score=65.49 TRINITY_DN763_c0_g1_i1:101-1639(-)
MCIRDRVSTQSTGHNKIQGMRRRCSSISYVAKYGSYLPTCSSWSRHVHSMMFGQPEVQVSNPSLLSWYPYSKKAIYEALELYSNREDTPSKVDDLSKQIANAVSNREQGWTLPQEFYIHPKIHAVDISKIWSTSWLFAGLSCEIPNPGDYMTFEVGIESVILVRDKKGKINAVLNVCRHRGSRICTQKSGHVNNGILVCPYHQWTYASDGKLMTARDMPSDFDKTKNGLYSVNVEEVGGLIYINLDKNPQDFNEARKVMEPEVLPHEFEGGKIAFSKTYEVNANWKVIYENNRDCYHCTKGHPEYVKSNYDVHFIYKKNPETGEITRMTDESSPKIKEIEEVLEEKTKYWQSQGLTTVCSPDSKFPGSGWYRASRVPLRKGWLVESIDGTPVSSLMGKFKSYDMGSMRIHSFPNFWMHASSDHAVFTKLSPVDALHTKATVSWVVHKDAVEGKDYVLDKMLPFWQGTSEQDWKLCEWNQQGLMSKWHEPGRLSESKETGVEKFIQWYLKRLS